MSVITISFMEQNDIRESVQLLSVAMLNNPLHREVFLGNGEKQRQEIETMFFELFNTFPGVVFVAKRKAKVVGVMRMKSCCGSVIDNAEMAADEQDIRWRKSVLLREWAKHDPLPQHWHLGPIGVLPTHQGSGIGSMLVERFSREVDACKASAYLETDLDTNVRFYEKFGFKVVAQSEIFGVKSWYMHRNGKVSPAHSSVQMK